jgi:hypothetical protein
LQVLYLLHPTWRIRENMRPGLPCQNTEHSVDCLSLVTRGREFRVVGCSFSFFCNIVWVNSLPQHNNKNILSNQCIFSNNHKPFLYP